MNRRLPENKNLILHTDPYYELLPVDDYHGPLIRQYLHRTLLTQERACAEYNRVTGVVCIARYPKNIQLQPIYYTNYAISEFFNSLDSKVEHNRKMAMQKYDRVHDTSVRYTWCREYGELDLPHFHIALFFNGDAYRSLGKIESIKKGEVERDNLAWRIRSAWASALNLPYKIAAPLIEFPDNPVYHVNRDPGEYEGFFYRASYLCKAATKRFGDGQHAFDSSRH